MTKTSEPSIENRHPVAQAQKSTTEILSGPIVPVMLKLALPTLAVLVIQTLVGVIETYFVSSLGANVIAGVSVVFPILTLMQMMANGGMGSGLSSAVARASGAGRRKDAEALVWHGVVIAVITGVLFAVALIMGGSSLYQTMGVSGPALSAALTYSNIVFISSPLLWVVALLSASLRGAGDARTPALITLFGAVILLPLSPVLIFGWEPIPSFGVAGAGISVVFYYVLAVLFLVMRMRSTKSAIRLKKTSLSIQPFKEILGVGLLSSIGTIQINLTVAVVTATVGIFGNDAVAGYGIASRLEYIQVPLLFGLGTAVITMVGINVGAGQIQRAQRISWTGAAIAFAFTQIVGLGVAVFPHAWLTIFSDEQQILAIGASYLRNLAPLYGLIGASMILYFASIGMKQVLLPVLAGTVRMLIAAFGGWVAVTYFDADIQTLFKILLVGVVVHFAITVASMLVIGKSIRLTESNI